MYLTFNGHAPHSPTSACASPSRTRCRREDIVKAAFFGRGATLAGVPIIPGTAFYDDKRAHGWDYDPAKAKALLAEAGVPNGFSCKLLSTAQYGMHKDTAEVVQQHLAEIGIQVELVLPDWATRVNMGNRGQYEFAVMGTAAENNDPDGLTPVAGRRSARPPTCAATGSTYRRSTSSWRRRARLRHRLPRRDLHQDAGRIGDRGAHGRAVLALPGLRHEQEVQGFANMPGALTFYSGLTLEDTSVAAA